MFEWAGYVCAMSGNSTATLRELKEGHRSDRIRLPPLELPVHARSILVVAPHPDDETLAAGGLIHDLGRAGWRVGIVVVTNGAASHRHVTDLSRIRERECRKAAARLGVAAAPAFLGFQDGETLDDVTAVAAALQPWTERFDVIVGPRSDDGHSDHVATGHALDLAGASCSATRLHYAIWGWDNLSSDELNISTAYAYRLSAAALEAKAAALSEYESQMTSTYGRVIVDDTVRARHTASNEVFWC